MDTAQLVLLLQWHFAVYYCIRMMQFGRNPNLSVTHAKIRSKIAFTGHLHLECLAHKSQLYDSTTAGNETKHFIHLLCSCFVSATPESEILIRNLRDFPQYLIEHSTQTVTKEPLSFYPALFPFILAG
jgi:hypothetical protein